MPTTSKARPGDDRIDAGGGNDTLVGGNGDDFLIGGNGPDLLAGGAGRDKLHGGTGRDSLHSGDGNDGLWGETDPDAPAGGFSGANDLLLAESLFADLFVGGRCVDTIDYSGRLRPVSVSFDGRDNDGLNVPGGDFDIYDFLERDELLGIEVAIGGAGGDALQGSPGPDTLLGGAGDDVFYYPVGQTPSDDDLFGGDGDDVGITGRALPVVETGNIDSGNRFPVD